MNLKRVIRGHIVTEDAILENGYLTLNGAVIESVSSLEPEGSLPRMEVDNDGLILPGFRDPHTHDVNGQLACMDLSETENARRIGKVTRAYAAHGVSAVYLATFGAPLEELLHYCRSAKLWMDCGENGVQGARLKGINIEGSFINEECRGAQPAEYCFIPGRMDCIDAVNRLHETRAVRMMNIVPDYGEPSLAVIQHARDLGILVGSGHLKPEAQLLQRAYHECGLQYMVHFTNGPTGQSFKPFGGGNAFEGAMTIPICKELILDRTHIDERYVLDMIQRNEERWGESRMIAITDGMFPIESEIPTGEFYIGSTAAVKDEQFNCLRAVAYLQPDGTRQPSPPNTLCGSILKMNRGFANLVDLFTHDMEGIWYPHAAMPWDQAVRKAARLCALHQAILEGSAATHGSIQAGKRADLVIGTLTQSHGETRLDVHQTLIDGRVVYSV